MIIRWKSTKEELLTKLSQYDTISFDMFDTLVTCHGVKLDDNIYLLSKWVKQKINNNLDFFKIWFRAVKEIKSSNPNYMLDDVYHQIAKMKLFTSSQLLAIKDKQIAAQINNCLPKKDMLWIFNSLIKQKKHVYIVSDMYLSSKVLSQVLNNCGYFGYKKIFVSCEVKKSKSSSDFWKYYFMEIDKKKAVHVGDNYLSDYRSLKKYGRNSVLINTGKIYSSKVKFLKLKNEISAQNRLIYGLIINKTLFNSPFKKFDVKKYSPYEFGYSILGPLFFSFFNNILKKKNFKKLLFVSREGYYFQDIYKEFNKIFLNTKETPSVYLLSSRQIATLSNVESLDDILWVCKFSVFQGWSKDFFLNRFNVKIDESDNVRVRKWQDNKLCRIARKYAENILAEAKTARTRYKKYLQQHVVENSCLIDVGYSGTSQYFVSRILKLNVYGAYFWLRFTKGASNFKINKNNMFSIQPYHKHKVLMHWAFGDIMECFLTAPYGQFAGFDSNNKPMYKSDVLSPESFKYRDLAYKGVIDLFKDIKKYSVFDCNKEIIDSTIAYNNLLSFYWYFKRHHVSKELETMLKKYDLFRGFTKAK